MELGQFTVRNHSGVRVRGGRGFRDEFSTFYASAYPQLAAQTLAITGDAVITRAATATTLSRVWRSWPSLRKTADVLVRARWTAVLVAAERESTARPRAEHEDAAVETAVEAAVEELTGAVAAMADTVVVAALQRLPRVQRRALVLHYMGGVSVRHLSELSGSSAEHIELLLDDGFTALSDSLEWSGPDDAEDDGPDLSFDWVAEALTDTAARLPEQIPAPLPTAQLRNATAVRWSVRVVPVAVCAACVAVMAGIAQPPPPELHVSAVSAAPLDGAAGGVLAHAARSDPGPTVDGGPHPDPDVRMRSIALMSLLDTHGHASDGDEVGPRPETQGPGVGRTPQPAQAAQAQRADGRRPVGGAGRAPAAAAPVGAATERPTGMEALPDPTADTGTAADFPTLQVAAVGGATSMAMTTPLQDDVLALPAEAVVRPVGLAATITTPQSTDQQAVGPKVPTGPVVLTPTGDYAPSQPSGRAVPSASHTHGSMRGDSDARGGRRDHSSVADR